MSILVTAFEPDDDGLNASKILVELAAMLPGNAFSPDAHKQRAN